MGLGGEGGGEPVQFVSGRGPTLADISEQTLPSKPPAKPKQKVLYTHKFSFVVTLTLLHSIFTAVGMLAMAGAGVFPARRISRRESFKIAAVYVGFIVANNLSIQLNPLGAGRAGSRVVLLGRHARGSGGLTPAAAGRRPTSTRLDGRAPANLGARAQGRRASQPRNLPKPPKPRPQASTR